jgi:erythromycin esterase-like protein
MQNTTMLGRRVGEASHPLEGGAHDYDPLLARIGAARIVLLGEASHGTHEFYRERAAITKRLIREKGFTAVAVEADWPDAYRINRYVRGGDGAAAVDALAGFRRFPAWMWRNADVLDFVGWLRDYNETGPARAVGFYGLDLYSLYTSIESVLVYLDKVDPEGAKRARECYGCFDHFGGDGEHYGYLTGMGLSASCEREVIAQLTELQRRAGEYVQKDGAAAEEAFFDAEQNARLIRNAERYYRTMFRGRVASWNLRDRHMADSLDALIAHLDRRHGDAKVVIWAHNSHLGDARATGMAAIGELNVGQLLRERYDGDAVLVGFTTYTGTVTAAFDWGEPARQWRVRPALPDSYEAVFHAAGQPAFLLLPNEREDIRDALRDPRLERAIGVIYRPETERISHYFEARLPEQFDAVIHIDTTRAIEPLERTAAWAGGEPPETFPVAV